MQTQVSNLMQGIYQFELRVVDAGGLFSKDTDQITVNSSSTSSPCSRPVIAAQLLPFGNLSKPRDHIVTVSVGNKVYFAGGSTGDNSVPNNSISTIDIYDNSTDTWSVSALSEPNWGHASIAVGNKIYWAGGIYLSI